jgi:hypothetical protein
VATSRQRSKWQRAVEHGDIGRSRDVQDSDMQILRDRAWKSEETGTKVPRLMPVKYPGWVIFA